ncbi:hypothetical protein GIB67_029677 [Kingdonia uniflora]|uniref:Serpin domain-containing protein n=1 Tax=Kingdonia uniflora TaxID=39325 RepID=A0A7J7LLU2_9MAGN|nr:hypothetical protein GIB67_029677 [Kingdonia uniflora]
MLWFLKSKSLDHLSSVGSQLIDFVSGALTEEGPRLSFVNGIWVEKSLALKPSFEEIASSIYRAETEAVDFEKRDGLHSLIEKASSDSGFFDRHLPKQKVEVRNFKIPKFKISFGFEASRALHDLGLVLPFDGNKAEFAELVTVPRESGAVYVSRAYHKCLVEVDEEGTEAAASLTFTLAEEVRAEVNKWAEKATNGFIKDALPPGSIENRTRLLLTNALYFKGIWKYEFEERFNYEQEILSS